MREDRLGREDFRAKTASRRLSGWHPMQPMCQLRRFARARRIPGDSAQVLWRVLAASLLKKAIVAFFNLAKCRAKLRTEAQNNDLRRYSVIASLRWRNQLSKSTGCYVRLMTANQAFGPPGENVASNSGITSK